MADDERFDLSLAPETVGAVVFAPGAETAGEDRTRIRFIVRRLNACGLGSAVFGPLAPPEAGAGASEADRLATLAGLITDTVDRVSEELPTAGLPVGTFGIGGGGTAALIAAAERPERVRAAICVDSDPARADADVLRRVRAPVLMIVGGGQPGGRREHEDALAELGSPASRLEVIAGAGDSVADDGLELVTELATAWFMGHLAPGMPAATEPAGG
jgi:pimeloyl-ACP methyl ester carboxylesterase